MPPVRVIDVGCELEVVRDAAAANLRAPARERAEHGERWRVGERRGVERLVPRLESGLDESLSPERPAHGGSEQVLFRAPRIPARRQVEVADAEVVDVDGAALIGGLERERLRQGVIDSGGEVGAIGRTPDRLPNRASRNRREDGLRVVGVSAVARERERRAVLEDRPVQREAVVLLLFGAQRGGEGVPRVERFVPEREVGRASQGSGAGAGRDVDEHEPAAVVFRRERVAPEPDAANLGLRRQLPAAETVDPDHRARARHLFQRGLHLIGIVRERLDLIPREHARKRATAWIERALASVLPDLDVLRMTGDGQAELPSRRAGAEPQVLDLSRLESRELTSDDVASEWQGSEHGLAAVVCRQLAGRARGIDWLQRDARGRNDGAALIEHGDPQRRVLRRLRGSHSGRGHDDEEQRGRTEALSA